LGDVYIHARFGGMAVVHIFHLWLIFWEDLHDDDRLVSISMVFIPYASRGESRGQFWLGGDAMTLYDSRGREN
jgi:hypothetical protein